MSSLFLLLSFHFLVFAGNENAAAGIRFCDKDFLDTPTRTLLLEGEQKMADGKVRAPSSSLFDSRASHSISPPLELLCSTPRLSTSSIS